MHFKKIKLPGVLLIEPEHHTDERGTFARTWCRREFEQHGISPALVQCNVSYNHKRGTLRGMHYQCSPYEEAKLVRVTRGAIYDVVLDLRPDSPTYRQWAGVGLSAESHKMLYIPEGVAHGFQTLKDGTEVFYQMSEYYHPESARGVRWNDPVFGIEWPEPKPIVAEKDQAWPDFIDLRNGIAA
jgi:dTDP-4-dehydrorhamnose 3,5-epimerase